MKLSIYLMVILTIFIVACSAPEVPADVPADVPEPVDDVVDEVVDDAEDILEEEELDLVDEDDIDVGELI